MQGRRVHFGGSPLSGTRADTRPGPLFDPTASRIIAPLGRRRLRDLSAEDVDRWLRAQAKEVSTRTLRLMNGQLAA